MCKLDDTIILPTAGADVFWAGSLENLNKHTGMQPGDIGLVEYFGGGLAYMYNGSEWVRLSTIPNSIEKSYTDIECKCCGSHQFKRIDNESIVCEYCGNKMYLKHN